MYATSITITRLQTTFFYPTCTSNIEEQVNERVREKKIASHTFQPFPQFNLAPLGFWRIFFSVKCVIG